MKIAATRDRAQVLLRNQEKISSLSSLSTGVISSGLNYSRSLQLSNSLYSLICISVFYDFRFTLSSL
jgi:hypothetical protein